MGPGSLDQGRPAAESTATIPIHSEFGATRSDESSRVPAVASMGRRKPVKERKGKAFARSRRNAPVAALHSMVPSLANGSDEAGLTGSRVEGGRGGGDADEVVDMSRAPPPPQLGAPPALQ